PLRAVTLLASPLHYTFGLDEATAGERLVSDLVNGKLSRDLNSYRGFTPQPQFDSAGLVAPTFGYTFRLNGEKNGPNQGVYVGAGSYLFIGTDARFDQQLVNILGASSNTYVPSASFRIDNITSGQAAGALTIGYRGRFKGGNSSLFGGDPDGVYVSANYH